MGGFFGSLGCHLSTCCLKPVCQGKPKWSQQIKFTGFGKKGLVWELYPTNITWKKKKRNEDLRLSKPPCSICSRSSLCNYMLYARNGIINFRASQSFSKEKQNENVAAEVRIQNAFTLQYFSLPVYWISYNLHVFIYSFSHLKNSLYITTSGQLLWLKHKRNNKNQRSKKNLNCTWKGAGNQQSSCSNMCLGVIWQTMGYQNWVPHGILDQLQLL